MDEFTHTIYLKGEDWGKRALVESVADYFECYEPNFGGANINIARGDAKPAMGLRYGIA